MLQFGGRLVAFALLLVMTASPAHALTPGARGYPVTPDPSTCTVAPVPVDALIDLSATPVAATPEAVTATESMPAGGEVRQEIEQAIEMVFACFNAGEPLRAFALYSESYLHRIAAAWASPQALTDLATPEPLGADQWTTIVEIRAIRLLPDGRVAATVVLDPALIPVQKIFDFVLVEEHGRWLIDDVVDELRFSLP